MIEERDLITQQLLHFIETYSSPEVSEGLDYKRFLAYGHKISFALIGKEALASDHFNNTLHDLAEDVILYDQQSCLSPQCVIVESGGEVSPVQAA